MNASFLHLCAVEFGNTRELSTSEIISAVLTTPPDEVKEPQSFSHRCSLSLPFTKINPGSRMNVIAARY